jgi:hypothetical protein
VFKEAVCKGYRFFTSTEYDDKVSLWSGRFKISDKNNLIVDEGFVTPFRQESEAQAAAEAAARAWIDKRA